MVYQITVTARTRNLFKADEIERLFRALEALVRDKELSVTILRDNSNGSIIKQLTLSDVLMHTIATGFGYAPDSYAVFLKLPIERLDEIPDSQFLAIPRIGPTKLRLIRAALAKLHAGH